MSRFLFDSARSTSRRVAVAQECFVQSDRLFDEYSKRPGVGDHVMQSEQQHVLIGFQTEQAGAKQRSSLQIESLGGLFQRKLLGFVLALRFRERLQVDEHHRYLEIGSDNLNRS